MPHTNGADDADVAATTRERATRLAAAARERGDDAGLEVAITALIEVAYVRKYGQNLAITLENLYQQFGVGVGNMGRLADIAHRGNDELRNEMRDGFAGMKALLTDHVERTSRISADLDARVEEIEQQPRRRRRDPEDSLVDVYEQLPTEVAERVKSSRAHDIDAIAELRDRNEETQKQLDDLLKEKRDAELKAAGKAERDAEIEKKATVRRESIGYYVKLFGGIAALVAACWGAWQIAEPHLVLHPVAPSSTPAAHS